MLWGWQWEFPVVPNLGSVVLQTPHHRLETHHTVRAGLAQKSNLSYVPRNTQIQKKTERNKDSERNRDSESQKKQSRQLAENIRKTNIPREATRAVSSGRGNGSLTRKGRIRN